MKVADEDQKREFWDTVKRLAIVIIRASIVLVPAIMLAYWLGGSLRGS
jgi:hypothetical protein